MQVEARRKVSHVDHIAFAILQPGFQDGRVALVVLAHRVAALEQQVDEAERIGRCILVIRAQQAAAQGVAVEMRIAPPRDARGAIHQRAGA